MLLPDDVLAARDLLPVKPAPCVLTGERVQLRPLDLDLDLAALFAASSGEAHAVGDRRVDAYDPDARVWRYMSGGPFPDAASLGAWLKVQLAAPDGIPLTVLDRATGTPIGVANLMANRPRDLKIELGAIWYGPAFQRTGASAEATFLMCAHAFSLGYRRVEWKCDSRNAPSRAAALAYGFTYEGTQDAHMIIKDQNRDTTWFRILDREWPDVGPRLASYAAR